jgi:hypothetical protein
MYVPVRFPSETDVILEDVARFRAFARRENPVDPRYAGRR